MSATAFFVTRNHEQSLGQAIRSVAGFARDVLVLDTGSTDTTLAIAEASGARVIPFAWNDDFAEACNAAVQAATTAWILWMNPDEELAAVEPAPSVATLEDPKVLAWQVQVRQLTNPNDLTTGITGWQIRLFRRHPSIRFLGRAHPTFAPPLGELAAANGQTIGSLNLMIHRHAYLSVPTPEKIRWVVRLLEAELRDRPGQLDFQIELGRNLLWLNDPRGHELLAEATMTVRSLAASVVPPSPWVGQLLEYLLSVSPEQARTTIDRTFFRDLAFRWFPRTPPVLWAVATERFADGDYNGASIMLERLLELGRSGRFEESGGFDPAIIGNAAKLNLALCWLHLRKWDEARDAFGQVVGDPIRQAAALTGYELALQRRKP